MMKHIMQLRIGLLLALISCLLPVQAANIVILNSDSPGEGLSDQTPFTAVGGNHAETLGQARLNALQYAANIVSQYIVSNVTIVINAQMNELGGDNGSAILGSAGPTSVRMNFGAGDPDTWYPIALAEALQGSNLNGSDDIVATFNSDVDNQTVLGDTDWYYGLDGNSGTDNDFVTVVLHEILHGLGFLTVMSDAGVMEDNQPDIFLSYVEHDTGSQTLLPNLASDADRLTAITDTGNLHWTGTNVRANSGSLTGGFTGSDVHMFAPSTLEPGSSVSHFSTAVTPDEIMEPYYVDADHNIGLSVYLMQDIGWTVKTGTGSADLHLALSNSGGLQQNTPATFTLVVTNNGANTAVETTVTYMMAPVDTYLSASMSQGSCTAANKIVTCRLGDLAASGSVTISMTINPGDYNPGTHAAIVSSATTESNAADNVTSNNISPTQAPTGTSGGCFIATAAWGSKFEPEVTSLRRFRDRYLLTNKPGQIFVENYYKYSPPVADELRKNDLARAVMRGSLGPLLAVSRWLNGEEKQAAD